MKKLFTLVALCFVATACSEKKETTSIPDVKEVAKACVQKLGEKPEQAAFEACMAESGFYRKNK